MYNFNTDNNVDEDFKTWQRPYVTSATDNETSSLNDEEESEEEGSVGVKAMNEKNSDDERNSCLTSIFSTGSIGERENHQYTSERVKSVFGMDGQ